jgi:uncharacterized repeat protein (TIGR03837 family)
VASGGVIARDSAAADNAAMRWDLFCRVVDNWGDLGVCWRLAADLAARGGSVRLWCDDVALLRWMAPQGAPGVAVHGWDDPARAADLGDVVIEAFGCHLPDDVVAAIGARRPVWINLEYLSAEAYVERSHGLPSPQPGGLAKWFFYPGFTAATGGLIREPGLIERRAAFDRDAWLARRGIELGTGERVVVLFCYPGAPVDALVAALQDRPTRLLATAGVAAPTARGLVKVLPLPHISQEEFDHLLWSADLNFVRGEDSLVRAIWAGAPFVWQLYPQSDGAQAGKLEAFLDRIDADAITRGTFRRWNGLGSAPLVPPPAPGAWRDGLLGAPDLVSKLLGFVASER